jgi:hypothetical protein
MTAASILRMGALATRLSAAPPRVDAGCPKRVSARCVGKYGVFVSKSHITSVRIKRRWEAKIWTGREGKDLDYTLSGTVGYGMKRL